MTRWAEPVAKQKRRLAFSTEWNRLGRALRLLRGRKTPFPNQIDDYRRSYCKYSAVRAADRLRTIFPAAHETGNSCAWGRACRSSNRYCHSPKISRLPLP
jgi:hypothetical protein